MKNKTIRIILIITITGILVIIGNLLWKKSIVKDKNFYFDRKDSPVYESKEVISTTEGFPADGSTYMIYYFNEENGKSMESQIKQDKIWKIKDNSKETQRYMTRDEMKKVENGYYLFCNLDFDTKVYDRYNDFHNRELGGQRPKEYSVQVFDTDNYIMYYYQWDS